MLRTPKDARWSCTQCGACCHHFRLGPVEPEIIAGLEEADITAHWPPAAEAPWHEDGFLTHRNNACVFLMPDRRCFIHAHLGEAAKPGFCRIFPFRFVEDPSGVRAVVRPTCTGFSRTHQTGKPLPEAVNALGELPIPVGQFSPETITLLPDRSVPFAEWLTAEAALLSRMHAADVEPLALVAMVKEALGVTTPTDPARVQLAMRAVLAALTLALRSTPSDAFNTTLRQHAAAALDANAPPPLSDRDRAFFNLLLRSHIEGRSFVPYGSLAAGVGLMLTSMRLARLVSPDDPSAILSLWSRFVFNKSAYPLLRRASPALVDVVRYS